MRLKLGILFSAILFLGSLSLAQEAGKPFDPEGRFVFEAGETQWSPTEAGDKIDAIMDGAIRFTIAAPGTEDDSGIGWTDQFFPNAIQYRGSIQPDFEEPIKRPVVGVPYKLDDTIVWPHGMGVMFQASDLFWSREIDFSKVENPLESMSIPVWGLIREGYTLSCIMDFGYESKSGKIEYTIRYYLDRGDDPLRPAYRYREYLKETGRHVTLEEKAKKTPGVDKLRGALHAYLWGSGLLVFQDVVPKKWRSLGRELLKDARREGTASHYLRQSFSDEEWGAVKECATAKWPSRYSKGLIAQALSKALSDESFVRQDFWRGVKLSEKTTTLLSNLENSGSAETVILNSYLLADAFPGVFLPVEKWGGGVSVKMLDTIAEAGIEYLKLCVEGHEAVQHRPWVAQDAEDCGWLFGAYDSYHSIHDPATAGTDATWNTAQMTQELWGEGAVKNFDGEYIQGFKGRGRKLNSLAGRSFYEERVSNNINEAGYNYYFIDCDATGEFFDDYSGEHSLSLEGDAAQRADRLEWIAETFNAVVGSEGGIGYFAPSIHVGEGIFGPYFGWDDPDMKDRESPWYRGRYYPPDGPEVNFKPIPLKERFQKLHYDPAHRIPLYGAALHDGVVVTHHWGNAHFKYPEQRPYVALTEVLYLSPPMYHFNLEEFTTRRDLVKEHYEVWSPLHRAFGFAAVSSFQHLTEDRLVQEAVYGGADGEAGGRGTCRIVVNYRERPYRAGDLKIPPMSAWIHAPGVWPAPRVYTPTPPTEEELEALAIPEEAQK